ncbi:RNA binding protein, heterogenous nuclear RNP-K like protein [Mycoemilia scoparia]|uniref:RNA binding protein, heterogenous nuclear RNP-K like protein n=1 Tax=Mycoemilia scoparia TaxID=417184 RepID=A0A9W8A0P1_9FUNG|nr:RNA binding protein, heterogenous nuclear RNP-K like protein [Mycoemilia scoparia]
MIRQWALVSRSFACGKDIRRKFLPACAYVLLGSEKFAAKRTQTEAPQFQSSFQDKASKSMPIARGVGLFLSRVFWLCANPGFKPGISGPGLLSNSSKVVATACDDSGVTNSHRRAQPQPNITVLSATPALPALDPATFSPTIRPRKPSPIGPSRKSVTLGSSGTSVSAQNSRLRAASVDISPLRVLPQKLPNHFHTDLFSPDRQTPTTSVIDPSFPPLQPYTHSPLSYPSGSSLASSLLQGQPGDIQIVRSIPSSLSVKPLVASQQHILNSQFSNRSIISSTSEDMDYSAEKSIAEKLQYMSVDDKGSSVPTHHDSRNQSPGSSSGVDVMKPFPNSRTPDNGSIHSGDGDSSHPSRGSIQQTPPTVEDAQLTVRALVSTKEAGVIIGKSGSVIAQLREVAGVRAGVTQAVSGVTDRVLSVIGNLENVAAAYELVARTLIENPVSTASIPSPSGLVSLQDASGGNIQHQQTVVRILIGHNLMGSVIGRQGLKIKNIQDLSGARLVATKEMLPQSTERVVEIHGTVDGIRIAVVEIGKCLIQDWDRGVGTVLYNPAARVPTVSSTSNPYVNNLRTAAEFMHSDPDRPISSQGLLGSVGGGFGSARHRSHTVSVTRTGNGTDFLSASSMPVPPQSGIQFPGSNTTPGSVTPTNPASAVPGSLFGMGAAAARTRSQSVSAHVLGGRLPIQQEIRTQEIRIPADMVGCIIGKAGSRITEIRRLSGSRISIAKASESESGERLFTITGTRENNEKALYLLYGQLEGEHERRLAQQQQQLQMVNEHGGSLIAGHEPIPEEN